MASDHSILYFNGIHVIESLRAKDDKTGQSLYNNFLKHQPTRYDGLHVDLEVVSNRKEFLNYLKRIRNTSLNYDYNPIIHIEAHGDEDGVELTSYETVSWDEIGPVFTKINVATNMNSLVTFGTCKGGYFAKRMIPPGHAPVSGIVGPLQDIESPKLEAGFAEFYQELLRSFNVSKAIQRIANASDQSPFNYTLTHAREIFIKGYRNYRENHFTPEKLKEREDRFIEMARESNTQAKYFLSSELRRMFRREIDNPRKRKKRFEKFKRLFFMCDIYPNNYERFDLGSIEGEV